MSKFQQDMIEATMEDNHFLIETKEPDGAGGWHTTYKEGMPFRASYGVISSTEMLIAEASGLKRIFVITIRKNTVIAKDYIWRRDKDGTTFRATSNSIDAQSPEFATIDMAQVTAERWDLPK